MVSASYSNLLDLEANYPKDLSKRLPRLKAFPENGEEETGNGSYGFPSSPIVSSSSSSSSSKKKTIIVADKLPLLVQRNPEDGSRRFAIDENSLLWHMKDGLAKSSQVLYVGFLDVDVEEAREQEALSSTLLEGFECLPVFVEREVREKYFEGFCKHHLWPLFHYRLPMISEQGARFDRSLWQAYVSVNKLFADRIMEVINSEDDFVWVHDYHLMAVATFLRKRYFKVKLGFFLHIPFPSSEIYRTLLVREEILRGLLTADLIGFHTFDYARHFLSCCSRMLGLHFKTSRGYISLDYFGRTVGVKISPIGVHMGRLMGALASADTRSKVKELERRFDGKRVLLGMDNLDVFQGIGLKLLALEQLLQDHPQWRGKLVLVQIITTKHGSSGPESLAVQEEVQSAAERINTTFGGDDYQPVVLIQRLLSLNERTAYYSVAECCVVTAIRDGLNLIPYEYTICRDAANPNTASQSMLIISEFIGCSPSLSGAIRVNPWNINNVMEAMLSALTMPGSEKEMRHEKHFRYASTHDVVFWARSFMADLERVCKDHAQQRCWGIGFGFGFRIVALDPMFRKLRAEDITSAYKRTTNRIILLDYDGTMVPLNAIDKTPGPHIISVLNNLCDDPNNLVFIVSGRSRDVLQGWFSPCRKLGLSAEHGYSNRWNQDEEWKTSVHISDFSWKEVVEPIMRRYTESTDGSYIEVKESALVWHYQDADPDFGSWQSKELLDHLESMLANNPVSVKSGHLIVEVKPQGVSKGTIAKELILSMVEKGKPPEFVLCIGDDRSDEHMFESIANAMEGFPQAPLAEVFACTVGQKPSKARYYVDGTSEVIRILDALTRPLEVSDINEGEHRSFPSMSDMKLLP